MREPVDIECMIEDVEERNPQLVLNMNKYNFYILMSGVSFFLVSENIFSFLCFH